MALTRQQKEQQLADLKDAFSKAQSIMFAHYIGMTVAEVSEFRRELRKANAEMKVAKKTLMRIAAKDMNLPEMDEDSLDGAVTCILSFADPLTGAQVAFKFGKTHPQVKLLGGMYDGKKLSAEEALDMAKMPSKEQLLATFVGMLQSPLSTFARMCNGPLTSFARASSELAKKGGAVPQAAAPAAEPAPAAAEPTPAPEAPAAEASAPATDAPAADAAPSTPEATA